MIKNKKKFILILSTILVVFFILNLRAGLVGAQGTGSEEIKAEEYKIELFRLQVPVPDMGGAIEVLSEPQKIVDARGNIKYLDIPWIAEYIRALYQFSIYLVGILAVVMVMVGGMEWVTAAGNRQLVSSAKGRISYALIGLFIALGSWMILNLINPALVTLKSIKIGVVERIRLNIDEAANEFWTDTACGGASNSARLEDFKRIVLRLNQRDTAYSCAAGEAMEVAGGYRSGVARWRNGAWQIEGLDEQNQCPPQAPAYIRYKYNEKKPGLVCSTLVNFFFGYWYNLGEQGRYNTTCGQYTGSGMARNCFSDYLTPLLEEKRVEDITNDEAANFGDVNLVSFKGATEEYHVGIIYKTSGGLCILHAAGFRPGIANEKFIYGDEVADTSKGRQKVYVWKLR